MPDLRNHHNRVASVLFSSDKFFHDELEFLQGQKENQRLQNVLSSWAENLPRWNEFAEIASRPENLPRLARFDAYGNRQEKIVLPLQTQLMRREVVECGIFRNETETEKFSKIYLLAQLGESGVTCPLACTDGLIRVLSQKGSEFLKTRYLPLLSSSEFPLAGAQFVTEQTGGSDVGAIEGRARPDADGTWKITAEKWYCSAYEEFFLVAARPEGAPSGTRGVAIFFVPREIEVQGKAVPNGVFIRRLKDKLGTQSLPTAEVDFIDAKAWSIGDVADGFQNLMDYVLNVSRVHNAANSLGFARRVFVEARNYASQRVAFGKALLRFPLIRESLFYQLAELSATRHVFLSLTHLLDTKGLLPQDNAQRFWQRFLINLCKYRTAVTLSERVKDSILIFGANGIIQDFSIVPRLLRDSLIVETWEGPHNVLCLQILRDAMRFDFAHEIKEWSSEIDSVWTKNHAPKTKNLFNKCYQTVTEALQKVGSDESFVHQQARRVVDLIGTMLETGSLMKMAIQKNNFNAALMSSYLLQRRMTGLAEQMEMPVFKFLAEDGEKLIWEEKILGQIGEL